MIAWLAAGADVAVTGLSSGVLESSPWLEGLDAEFMLQSNDDDGDGFLAVIAGFFIGLGLIVAGVNKYRKSRLIKDTATEQVHSMAAGRTELEGIAHPAGDALEQPFTDGACLYASWEIEEYTKDDDDDYSWDTVSSGSYADPFLLEDDTGTVTVEATTDATWELTGELASKREVGSGSTPAPEIAAFCEEQGVDPVGSNKRRYSQTVLSPETSVYVLGEASPRDLTDQSDIDMTDAGQRLTIQRDTGSDRFIISNLEEEELASRYGTKAKQYVGGGLLLSTVCLTIIMLWIFG